MIWFICRSIPCRKVRQDLYFFFSMYQPIVETWANLSHYVHMPLELRENKCQWQLHFMGAIMMERKK